MLILLGIDSEFGTLEGAIAPFYDMKWVKMRKELFTGKYLYRLFNSADYFLRKVQQCFVVYLNVSIYALKFYVLS